MLRAVVSLTLMTICGALKMDPQPDDAMQLGETDRAVMKIGGGAAGSDEAEASRAFQGARRDEAETNSSLAERQADATDRRTQPEARGITQETKSVNVVDSTMREGNAESRAAEGIERQERLTGIERELAKFERALKRMDGHDAIDTNIETKEIKREELQEHNADLKFARENSDLKKQPKDARNMVNLAKGKQNDYRKHRTAIEAETRKRLWQKADAMRTSASNLSKGALSETEIVHLLDISRKELGNITSSIMKTDEGRINTTWYDEHLFGLRFKSASASSTMLEAIKLKAEDFKSNHLDYDDHQFMGLLYKLLNDTITEIRNLVQTSDTVLNRLQRWDGANPEKLTYNMAVALHGVTGSVEFKNHILQVDTGSLYNASAGEACDLLSNMLTSNVQPAYKSLVRMRGAMDSISKIVPSIVQKIGETEQSVMVNRTATVINMAYAQQLALTEASGAILQQAVPVIVDRLRCNFRSSSLRSGFGLAALGAVAAWLGQ